MAGKRIPDHIRRKVGEDFESGLSKKKIAETYDISATSVTRILREKSSKAPEDNPVQKGTSSPEMQRKLSDIERRISDLEKNIIYLEARNKGKGTRV